MINKYNVDNINEYKVHIYSISTFCVATFYYKYSKCHANRIPNTFAKTTALY